MPTVFPVSGSMILVSMLGSGRPMVLALSSTVSVVRVWAATGEHSVWPNTIEQGAQRGRDGGTAGANRLDRGEVGRCKGRMFEHRHQHGGNAHHGIAAIGGEQLQHEARLERLEQHLCRGLGNRADHAADAASGMEQWHGGDEYIAGAYPHPVGGIGAIVQKAAMTQ